MKARVQKPSSLRPPMSWTAATGRGVSVMKASNAIAECSVAHVDAARSASSSRCRRESAVLSWERRSSLTVVGAK